MQIKKSLSLLALLLVATVAQAKSPQERYDNGMRGCLSARENYQNLKDDLNGEIGGFGGMHLDVLKKAMEIACRNEASVTMTYQNMRASVDLHLMQKYIALCPMQLTQSCDPQIDELMKLEEDQLNAWILASQKDQDAYTWNNETYTTATGVKF